LTEGKREGGKRRNGEREKRRGGEEVNRSKVWYLLKYSLFSILWNPKPDKPDEPDKPAELRTLLPKPKFKPL
jgi:hypothetical protein